jgi:hypothetical protein
MTYELLKGLFTRTDKEVAPELLAKREEARALLAKLLNKKVEELGDSVRLYDVLGNNDPANIIGMLTVHGYGMRGSGGLVLNNIYRDTIGYILAQID